MAEESEQLRIAKEMNATLLSQRELLTAISDRLGTQAGAARECAAAAEEAATANDKFNVGLTEAAPAADGAGTAFESLNEKIKRLAIEPLSASLSLLKINFFSLSEAISNPVAASIGVLAELYNVIIAKSVQLAKESYMLADAFEDVRAKFGSFNETTSRTIKTSYQQFGSSLKEAAGNSSAFSSKFSMGVAGSVEKLKKLTELATDLGPVFDMMSSQFKDASAELYVLKDGLNFSSEAIKQTAVLAQLSGKSLKSFSQDIEASVYKIGKNFGISSKVLGQDVGKALTNFKMLGKMTGDYVKEITKSAVFTRKLGIELDALTGLVDKFDEFEGGAEAAAQLAQGFGMVIDPLKMMGMEAGPRLADLQRAFAATGRSIDSMSRQERALLATTAGLTEEQAVLAFSSKGLSMSYEEISSGADSAAKKQMTTEQIMNKLADNIENVITQFSEFTGFITAFFEGFGRGFMGEGSVMGLLKQLARQLLQVAGIGQQVGRMFAKVIFGGEDAKSNGKAVLGMFSKVGDMFVSISNHIKDFVGLMDGGDVPDAAKRLFTNIFGTIEKTFTGAAGGINPGAIIGKIGMFMVGLLRGAIRFLIDQIPNWTANINGMFTEGGEGGFLGSIMDGLGELITALLEELPAILPQLEGFASAIIDAIPRFFEKFPVTTLLLAVLPSLTKLAADFSGGVYKMIVDGFKGGMSPTAAEDLKKNLSEGFAVATAAAKPASVIPEIPKTEGEKVDEALKNATPAPDGVGDFMKNVAKLGALGLGIAAAPVALKVLAEGLRDSILVFTNPIGNGETRSLIEVLRDQVKMFAGVDPSKIASVGLMVAGLITASIGIGAASIAGITAPSQADIASLKASISATLDAVVSTMDEIGTVRVKNALSKVDMISGRIDKLKSVAELMSSLTAAVGNIIKSIPTAADLAGFGTINMTIEQKLKEAVGVAIRLFSDADGGILSSLANIKIPAGLTVEKMTTISTIVETASKMGASAGSLAELGAGKLVPSNVTKALTFMYVLGRDLGATLKPFDDLISAKQMSENENKMQGAINIMATYISGVAKIDAAGLTTAAGVDFNGPAFAPLMESGGLQEVIEALSAPDLFQNADMLAENVGNMDNFAYIMEKYVDVMDSASTNFAQDKLDAFADRVSAVVEHTRTIRGILENLADISLDATIDKLESNMRVAKTTMSINGGAVNVNVMLNVTMNSEKIAAALVMEGYVAPNADFNNYLLNNNGVGEYYENPGTNYSYGGPAKATVAGTGVKAGARGT